MKDILTFAERLRMRRQFSSIKADPGSVPLSRSELLARDDLSLLTRDELERLVAILREELAEERRLKSAIQAQANEELELRRYAEAQLLAAKGTR